jgi:ABC-2 type transport system permease protein
MRLVWHQYRYDRRVFWRDPAAVFFTVALPLVFLFLFVSIFGNQTTTVQGRQLKVSTYYVPGIITLSVISATFFNLAISVTISREQGLLKRLRGTPLPASAFFGGRILNSTVVALLMVVVVVGIGRVLYGVAVPTATLPGALLALVVGAGAFCALGLALTVVIPSEGAAPAITNAIILPLYFISGVFLPDEALPVPVRQVADIFPVKHLFQSLLTAFDPNVGGPGVAAGDIAVVAAWGIAGLLVAARTFRWTPRGD